MQGDYFSFNQGPPVNGYAAYGGYMPYGYPLPTPTVVNNKPLEKLKRPKQRSVDGRKYDEVTNSTDESIHLVRSRKTGESAPNRYDSDLKKRSQSGNSLAQQASQLTDESRLRHRSQSDERSVSPSNVILVNNLSSDSSAKKSKKRKDRKHKKYIYSDVEQVYSPQFGGQYVTQSGYQQYPQETWVTEYPVQPGAYPTNGDPYYPGYGYDVAPGAPQVDCSQYPGCVPAPNGYDQGYGAPSYYPDPCQPCPPQPCAPVPCQPYPEPAYPCYEQTTNGTLPPGAKIVAEYFLGYLDEQPTCQPEYQTQYTYEQSQSSESSKEDIDIEVWEKTKKKEKVKKAPSQSSTSSSSESEIEKPRKEYDDLSKLKRDIIDTIKNELGNLKLDAKDPVQPIFLMPKNTEQQKPIYIPRNVYVPVVRPVFVPRERIIVRPQIIHVARPVLVDRPVPIQQRPIVIERDRAVAVDKEGCVETTRNIESGQEVTYHEFTQTYPNANGEYPSSANYQYNEHVEYEDNRRNKEVYEERKQNLESKSSEEIYNSKAFESLLANSQGYTLEVLDQRISDKFEKTDQETIKARYGVDSYHYLPPGAEVIRSASAGAGNAEFYSQTSQSLGASAKNSNTNLYGNYAGNIQDLYGSLNSPGSRNGINQSQFNGSTLDN